MRGEQAESDAVFQMRQGSVTRRPLAPPPAQASPLPMPCPVESEVSQERWRECELIQYKSLGLK